VSRSRKNSRPQVVRGRHRRRPAGAPAMAVVGVGGEGAGGGGGRSPPESPCVSGSGDEPSGLAQLVFGSSTLFILNNVMRQLSE
jgi:hypothetical protein